MKLIKLFALAVVFVLSANVYSQWSYCNGSINMSGLGSFPFLSVVDANTVWVCGGTGGAPKVYRSTNAGANFVNVTGTLTGPEFYAIWAIDANTCLVGDGGAVGGTGGNAKIWRTTDGGTTWATVLTTGGTLGFFNGIVGLNSNRNWLYTQSDAPTGGAQFVATSTNGGANWTTGTTTIGGTTGAAGSLWASSTTAYGHGISGFARCSFTTNGGSSFTQGTLTVVGNFTSGFTMNDNATIMLASTSTSLPNINRSTNGGSTWTSVSVTGTIGGLSIIKWIPGTNACYVSGATGTGAIRKSVNGGATWTAMTTPAITGWNDMAFVNNAGTVTGYAIAGDGSVIKVTESYTGINPNNTSIPERFVLEQNYPNPFNPTTSINYSVPVAGNVTIKIFNSLGAEVMTVVNGNHTAGNYVENVDMSRFTSGVYFYTLTSGDFKETRKMMLVK